jgi:hypothetical protein
MSALKPLFLAAIVGCGGAGAEGSEPAAHPLPPDRTEVKMEVASPDAGAPESPSTPAPAASSAPAAPAPPSAADDPNVGGTPSDSVVATALEPIRGRLRACYKKALATDPKLAGTATFDATIAKDGKVASARFVKREGLSEDMMGCLTTALKAMTFPPGQKSQIVPLTFGNAGSAAPKP